MMKNHCNDLSKLTLLVCFCFLFSLSCTEKKLGPDDVEYRKDDNGTKILYQIGATEPFGFEEEAFIVKKHPNGNLQYSISFLHGRKDGPFTFWQKNELPLITGSYKQGKRDGIFTAYGKIGEIVYEKTYKMGELDGNFSLYYPASNHDLFRYKDELKEKKLEPGELKVKNNLRLQTQFKDGNPNGTYFAYLHPGGKNLALKDLIKEEGSFNEEGLLSNEQFRYFPRTSGLGVVLPVLGRFDEIFEPNELGFSKAIDQASDEIAKIPTYRNPKNLPAYVYTLDDKGNEIVPIWSTHIKKFAIRNMDGYLLPDRFEPKYEYFTRKAKPSAIKLVKALDLSGDPNLAYYEKKGMAVEVVGIDAENVIIDILWSSRDRAEVISLDERINARRTRIRRSWSEGFSNEADWLLHNGSQLSLRAQDELARFGIDR